MSAILPIMLDSLTLQRTEDSLSQLRAADHSICFYSPLPASPPLSPLWTLLVHWSDANVTAFVFLSTVVLPILNKYSRFYDI